MQQPEHPRRGHAHIGRWVAAEQRPDPIRRTRRGQHAERADGDRPQPRVRVADAGGPEKQSPRRLAVRCLRVAKAVERDAPELVEGGRDLQPRGGAPRNLTRLGSLQQSLRRARRLEGDGGAQCAGLQAQHGNGLETVGGELCRRAAGQRRRLAPGERRQCRGGAPDAEGLQRVHRDIAHGRNGILQQGEQRARGLAVAARPQRNRDRRPQSRVLGLREGGGEDVGRRRRAQVGERVECCETLVVALRSLERVQHRCDGGVCARAAEREENALSQRLVVGLQQIGECRDHPPVRKVAQSIDRMVAYQRVGRARKRGQDDAQGLPRAEATQRLDAVRADRRGPLFRQAS